MSGKSQWHNLLSNSTVDTALRDIDGGSTDCTRLTSLEFRGPSRIALAVVHPLHGPGF
jgi:hypothetical protein